MLPDSESHVDNKWDLGFSFIFTQRYNFATQHHYHHHMWEHITPPEFGLLEGFIHYCLHIWSGRLYHNPRISHAMTWTPSRRHLILRSSVHALHITASLRRAQHIHCDGTRFGEAEEHKSLAWFPASTVFFFYFLTIPNPALSVTGFLEFHNFPFMGWIKVFYRLPLRSVQHSGDTDIRSGGIHTLACLILDYQCRSTVVTATSFPFPLHPIKKLRPLYSTPYFPQPRFR